MPRRGPEPAAWKPARSPDAERRAYQWCREYLGGAWRQARPEELRLLVEVRGHPLLCARWVRLRPWGPSAFLGRGAGPGARARGLDAGPVERTAG